MALQKSKRLIPKRVKVTRAKRTNRVAHGEEEVELKEKYLDHFQRIGYAYHAAKMVGISPRVLHRWIEDDPAFAERYKEIAETIEKIRLNDLEAAAFMRAIERSDQLMKFLLASLDPKYRDRVEQDVRGRVQVEFEDNIDTTNL